jgi:hypothetical protein
MLDQRGQLLRAAVAFAGCSMPSYDRALQGRKYAVIISDLVDLGLALAFAIVAIAITALLKLRTKVGTRRSGRRGGP